MKCSCSKGAVYIAGIPRNNIFLEAYWHDQPDTFRVTAEIRRISKVWVDDGNTDSAEQYQTVVLHADFTQYSGKWSFKEFLRGNNVLDKKYIGSVVVNEANRRFFEPAPGRNFLIGFSAALEF